jgi:hypothetical protein
VVLLQNETVSKQEFCEELRSSFMNRSEKLSTHKTYIITPSTTGTEVRHCQLVT